MKYTVDRHEFFLGRLFSICFFVLVAMLGIFSTDGCAPSTKLYRMGKRSVEKEAVTKGYMEKVIVTKDGVDTIVYKWKD